MHVLGCAEGVPLTPQEDSAYASIPRGPHRALACVPSPQLVCRQFAPQALESGLSGLCEGQEIRVFEHVHGAHISRMYLVEGVGLQLSGTVCIL